MRRLQGINDVQVMGRGLGEVLPGMSAGVATDVVLLPIGRRASSIMVAQAGLVILTFVAEQLPESPPATSCRGPTNVAALLATVFSKYSSWPQSWHSNNRMCSAFCPGIKRPGPGYHCFIRRGRRSEKRTPIA